MIHNDSETNYKKDLLYSPHFKNDFKLDIGNVKFSLLLDKFTDISVTN